MFEHLGQKKFQNGMMRRGFSLVYYERTDFDDGSVNLSWNPVLTIGWPYLRMLDAWRELMKGRYTRGR